MRYVSPVPTHQLDQSKILTPEEWAAFERNAKGSLAIPEQERNALMLLIAFRTGARASEVLNLAPADYFVRENSILIRGLKGSRNREIVIPPYLGRALASYLKRNPDLEKMFPIGYHRLRQVWDWYRPAPKKLHSLRHTFALETFKKTHDIYLVRTALGHRSIQNTMIYVEYYYATLELKRAVF